MLARLALVALFASSSALYAQTSPELRMSGTSAFLEQGDTYGLVAGLRLDAPLVPRLSVGPAGVALLAYGGGAGLQAGNDFPYGDEGRGVGYGPRTLGMVEAGLAARARWIELSAGPSLRYRSEARSVRVPRPGDDVVSGVKTEVAYEKRLDIGVAVEGGVRLPVFRTMALGAHVSLRRYDAGTQVAGVGVSGAIQL